MSNFICGRKARERQRSLLGPQMAGSAPVPRACSRDRFLWRRTSPCPDHRLQTKRGRRRFVPFSRPPRNSICSKRLRGASMVSRRVALIAGETSHFCHFKAMEEAAKAGMAQFGPHRFVAHCLANGLQTDALFNLLLRLNRSRRDSGQAVLSERLEHWGLPLQPKRAMGGPYTRSGNFYLWEYNYVVPYESSRCQLV